MESTYFEGPYKKAYIAAQRQAKFWYHGKLRPPQLMYWGGVYTRCRSTRDTLLSLVYCGSCTAAAIYMAASAAVYEG